MLGTSYYPIFYPASEWSADLERIKSAGFELVRTAEHKCDWEQLEPRPGEYEFGWLDRFMDLAHGQALQVLLGTGTTNPPFWLLDEYPDMPVVSSKGARYDNRAMWNWACFDHPELISAARRFIATLVDRYRDHPALYGWQLHNEIGYPWRANAAGELAVYCYCAYTQAEFREWLRRRYDNLEGLNRAWQSSATNPRYTSWEQVSAPRRMPREWASMTSWIDWRQFSQQNVARYIAWQDQEVKAQDPDHPTMTNTFLLTTDDRLGTLTAIDPWLLAEGCDALGFDLYPGSGGKLSRRPEFVSLFLSLGYSAARSCGKRFWVPEIQSGPIGGWFAGPEGPGDPRDIARFHIEAIAHGSDVNLYIGWRERRPLALRWDSLCDFDGVPTERLRRVSEAAGVVRSYQRLIGEAEPAPARIAIVYDMRSGIAATGVGEEDLIHDALAGTYRAFWEEHYSVDFVRADLLDAQCLDQYALVLMPAAVCVSREASSVLSMFVERGGWLVTSANCGFLDGKGWRHRRVPGAGLDELCGVRQDCLVASEQVAIVVELDNRHKRLIEGAVHREELSVRSSRVDVLGRYQDTGTPAVTSRAVGRGRAVHIASHIGLAYFRRGAVGNRLFLADLAEVAGIRRPVRLLAPVRPGAISVRLLRHESGSVIVLTSQADEEVEAILGLRPTPDRALIDLRTGGELHIADEREGEGVCSTQVPARGYVLLQAPDWSGAGNTPA